MSNANQLIEALCPEGVNFAPLNTVAKLKRGTSITKKQVTEGDIPVVAGGRTAAYFHGESNREGGTIVIAGSGAYAGYVSWWEGPIFVSDAFSVKPEKHFLIPRYCYYWLTFQQEILHSLKSGGGVPHVYAKDVGKLRIPVPPLEIQHVIVEILDDFAHLESEHKAVLESELEARRTQYEYYRTMLLSSGEDWRWTTLGESFALKAGKSIKSDAISSRVTSDRHIPCFGGNGIRGFVESHSHNGQFPLIGRQGALCGNVNWAEGYFYATEHAIVATPHQTVNARWAYHMLGFLDLNKYATKSAQPGLSVARLKRVPFPLPDLQIQRETAAILDKFGSLINDLNSVLFSEIAARRKQYEYYRDKLLTFKELSV